MPLTSDKTTTHIDIFAVDDDADDRMLIRDAFAFINTGIRVHLVNHGRDALS